MNLLPTAEQSEITSVIADFLANEVPIRRYQEQANLAAPYPAELWQQFVELGWFGVSSPESLGGSGLGMAEEILLTREAGRQLVSPTVLATAFSARLAAEHEQDSLATSLINGEQRAALALRTEGNSYLLFDSEDAEFLIAVDDGRIQLFSNASADSREQLKGTDESLSIVRTTLSAPAVLETDTEGDRLHLAVLLCAALTGIAESACRMAVSYASEREQFGQPIGAFQAIKHLCADMAVRNEAAWSQCVYAGLCLQDKNPDALQQIAAAAKMAATAALENARSNIQVHGGVGFTVEYDAHLLVKRTHVLSEFLNAVISKRDLLIK